MVLPPSVSDCALWIGHVGEQRKAPEGQTYVIREVYSQADPAKCNIVLPWRIYDHGLRRGHAGEQKKAAGGRAWSVRGAHGDSCVATITQRCAFLFIFDTILRSKITPVT